MIPSNRNEYIDFQIKSIAWFLHDGTKFRRIKLLHMMCGSTLKSLKQNRTLVTSLNVAVAQKSFWMETNDPQHNVTFLKGFSFRNF